jgi:hypothetical protein
MGSVTYRILCLSPTLVLAIPPQPEQEAQDAPHVTETAAGVR